MTLRDSTHNLFTLVPTPRASSAQNEQSGSDAARTFTEACETVADFLIEQQAVITPLDEESKEIIKDEFVRRCLNLTEELLSAVELNSFLFSLDTTPYVRDLVAKAVGGEPIEA